MAMRVLGIDPGYSGAVAILEPEIGLVDAWDVPIMLTEGKLKYIDGLALDEIITNAAPDLIVIERVASRPKQGVASSFAFGVAFGGVLTSASAYPCPLVLVNPAVWKRRYGLIGQSKEGSRQKALSLWPEAKHLMKRKKDNGRAEALLLADYGLHYEDKPKRKKKR